jgi:hypothetical protein
MSPYHSYTSLSFTGCDMLLECDMHAALAIRARQQQQAILARDLVKHAARQVKQQEGASSSSLGFESERLGSCPCPLQKMQVCVCVCAYACVCMCVRVCVRAYACVCVRARVY